MQRTKTGTQEHGKNFSTPMTNSEKTGSRRYIFHSRFLHICQKLTKFPLKFPASPTVTPAAAGMVGGAAPSRRVTTKAFPGAA